MKKLIYPLILLALGCASAKELDGGEAVGSGVGLVEKYERK